MVPERFFDCNATTPLSPAARTALLAALDSAWHNASGLYREAAATRDQLEAAREQWAEWLDCDSEEIVFTSGATESNNAVIRWAAGQFPDKKIAVSALEHPSVREPAAALLGPRLEILPAENDGTVCLERAARLLRDGNIALLSVMAANNETGVLQPWQALADLCRTHAVLFHCDAAQWIGKLPLAGLGQCDFLTASGHKFGGPKGVGLLKAPRRLSTLHAQYGGHQEHDRRAGTENVPAVLSTTAALQNLLPQLELLAASAGERRDAFESQLRSLLPGIQIIGASSPRLWNTSMLVMPEFPNVRWVARLSDRGFSISTGSACSTGRGASEVLSAMDVHPDALRRVLRVSSAASTTPEHWSALARAIFETWNDLRQQPASRAARNAEASQ